MLRQPPVCDVLLERCHFLPRAGLPGVRVGASLSPAIPALPVTMGAEFVRDLEHGFEHALRPAGSEALLAAIANGEG